MARSPVVKFDRDDYTNNDLEDYQHPIYFSVKLKWNMVCDSRHILTHSGGFVQQELEGAVCCLRGFQLSVTECYQIVFHMLVNPAIQGLSRDRKKESGDMHWTI